MADGLSGTCCGLPGYGTRRGVGKSQDMEGLFAAAVLYCPIARFLAVRCRLV